MINPIWRCFLSRKRFEILFESQKKGFLMGIESGRRKTINHDFVQGQGNPPSCQRFATSRLQIFDTRVDFSFHVQSRGRFL